MNKLYRSWLVYRTRYYSARVVYVSTRATGANRKVSALWFLLQLLSGWPFKVTLSFGKKP